MADQRQAAVDKRGYYNEADIRSAKRDPKVRANFAAVDKERQRRKAARSKRR